MLTGKKSGNRQGCCLFAATRHEHLPLPKACSFTHAAFVGERAPPHLMIPDWYLNEGAGWLPSAAPPRRPRVARGGVRGPAHGGSHARPATASQRATPARLGTRHVPPAGGRSGGSAGRRRTAHVGNVGGNKKIKGAVVREGLPRVLPRERPSHSSRRCCPMPSISSPRP